MTEVQGGLDITFEEDKKELGLDDSQENINEGRALSFEEDKKEEKSKEKISSFDDDGNIKTSNMAADREKKEERRDRRERGREFDRRDVYRRDKSTGNRKEIIEATSKDIGRHKRLFQVGITGLQENKKLDKKEKSKKNKNEKAQKNDNEPVSKPEEGEQLNPEEYRLKQKKIRLAFRKRRYPHQNGKTPQRNKQHLTRVGRLSR